MIRMTNMDRFNKQKDDLLLIIKNRLKSPNLDEIEKASLNQLMKIMNEYTFINRLEMKGVLSRAIIDSLTLDYSIGEKFIEFDNRIE